jgi:hypothetical protein
MKSVSFKLPDSLHRRLTKAAKDHRVHQSQILRNALEAYLIGPKGQKRPTMWDLVGDLAGCLKGGPTDLATNPKHMEGFGR